MYIKRLNYRVEHAINIHAINVKRGENDVIDSERTFRMTVGELEAGCNSFFFKSILNICKYILKLYYISTK